MSIWKRIAEYWHDLSWHGLFGVEPDMQLTIGRPDSAPSQRSGGTKQIGFTIAVIALAAKMANANGVVTESEITAFHEVFRAPPHEQANVDFFFNLARRSTTGAESYARQVAKLLEGERCVLEDLIGALFHIALADGRFDSAEDSYLARIAAIFGFDETEYRRIRANHVEIRETDQGLNDPHLVLGLPDGADSETIRNRWRDLVREHHPDRAIALGLPPEFVHLSNTRMARINAAYRQLIPRSEPETA